MGKLNVPQKEGLSTGGDLSIQKTIKCCLKLSVQQKTCPTDKTLNEKHKIICMEIRNM